MEMLITLSCRICLWLRCGVLVIEIISQSTGITVPLVKHPFSPLNSLWMPSRLVGDLKSDIVSCTKRLFNFSMWGKL